MKKIIIPFTAIAVSSLSMSENQIRHKNVARPTLNIKNRLSFRYLFVSILFMLLSVNVAWGQSYLGLDGGLEGTATIDNTTINSAAQSGKWTKNNATTTIALETGTVRSGTNSIRVQNTSTTARRIWAPLMAVSTSSRVVVQYYRRVAATTAQETQEGINRNGTESLSGSYGNGTANTWTKVVYAPTGTTATANNLWAVLMTRVPSGGTAGDMFIDDVCVYVATAVDNTATNAATAATFSGQTSSSIGVSWTAPTGGTDNGGYIVVRGTSDPTTVPNTNGIYAVNNTIGGGTVVYQGTGTSFTDTGLSPSTTYYYRIYVYDKAYNYSSALTGSSATTSSGTPTITLGTSTLTGFTYNYGSGPSAEQNFTISGSNLTANISIAPPTDYEISTGTGGSFVATNPITLTQSGGTVASTTIYVRLKSGLAVASYNSENITASSTGATDKTVACSGSVACIAPTLSFTSATVSKLTGDAAFTNTLNTNSSGTVTYSSNNASVATVNSSSGLVTIVGTGSATITASQAAGGNYCAGSTTFSLTVTCNTPTASFASSSLTKNIGDASFTNTFTSNSPGAVTYSSSNTSVATINSSSGLVTIVGAGTTTITANQAASGNYCSGSTTYTLNVRSVTVSPSSLSFSSNVGVTSAAQTVTVTGTNLSTTPTYSISGADAAMFSASGTLTTSGGTISVAFTPTSVGGKSATLTVSSEGGAIIKTVSLTGTASLSTPTATSATNISTTSFAANWNTVSGASCYNLNVYTKTGGGNATDLFISQYFEGATGTNKVIEIFNGTGASVNLSNYSIKKQTNGSGAYADELTLSGTLANNDVYVIASSGADFAGITSNADLTTTSAALTFNGNDAVALFKSGIQIDEVGIFNQTTDWGKDLTLIRNSNISAPKATYDANDWSSTSGGTNAETTNIGSHSFSGGLTNTPISGSPFTGIATNSYSITGLNSGTTYYYTVVATDCGSTNSGTSNEISVTTTTGPTISVSPSTVSGLDYAVTAGPSASQSITVTGSSLSAGVTVTAPTNFQVSTDNSTFSNSVSLASTGGTIYTRLIAGLDIATYTGNITLTSTGATDKTVSLTGTVSLPAPTATAGSSITSNSFTANWNAVSGADGYKLTVYLPGTNTTIVGWNFEDSNTTADSGIAANLSKTIGTEGRTTFTYPGGLTTTTASISSSGWDSGANTKYWQIDFSTTGYSSIKVNSVQRSSSTGPKNFKIQYKIGSSGTWTDVPNSDVIVADDKTTGKITDLSLPSACDNQSSVYLRWIMKDNTSVSNATVGSTGTSRIDDISVVSSTTQYILQSYDVGNVTSFNVTGLNPGTTYYYYVTAYYGTNNSASSNTITVTTTTGPSINVTPTSLAGLDYVYGQGPSANKTFTVTGSDLSTDIIISAPADYEISTSSSSGFGASITLPQVSGSVAATTIYVRLKVGLNIGSYDNETISLTTTGASKSILANGTVSAENIVINDVIDATNWDMSMPLTGTLKIYEKTTGGGGYATDLFFSKYLEGESENKLLEIFNGTSSSINLSTYTVQVFQNGGGAVINWSDAGKVRTYTLSGTLEPGDTKVIYTKETTTGTICDASIFNSAWQEFTGINKLLFNGNDPIVLLKNGTPIDIIGQYSGTTPSSYWGDATLNTLRVFLVRKNTVKSGANAVSSNTTSFATLTTEWTMQEDIPTGVSGATCNAITSFGSYDYNATYSNWTEITGAVSNTNQVTLSSAGTRVCEELKAEITDGGTTVLTSNTFRVPIIISTDNTVGNVKYSDNTAIPDTICHECDIAVLSGAKLTASTAGKKFHNAFVLAGGKLDVQNNLELNDLILKAGYTGNLYDSFPTSSVKVDATNGIIVNGTFGYVRQIDDSQWYFISFPYDVKIADILGLNSTLGTFNTDWFIKYWDGQGRATDRTATGHWIRISDINTSLSANVGYIIGLASGTKQVFFPLKKNYTIPTDASKAIPVTAYVKDATSDPYSDGWNLIGIPYFTKLTGTDFPSGYKILLSDGGSSKTYTVKYASDITTSPINPFISYYIQVGTTGNITFNTTSRSLAPRKVSQTTDFDNVRIFYTSVTGKDYMNLELDETQSTGYIIGRDFVKWFGTGTAKPQVYMTQGGYNLAVDAVDYTSAVNIPVTVYNKTAGTTTFAADATYAQGLSSLILTDNVTGANTDLLISDYSYIADAGTVNNRFTLSAKKVITGTKTIKDNNIKIISTQGIIRVENIPINSTIELYDTVGRTFISEKTINNIKEFSNLSKGIYIVQISTEGKRSVYKIIL